MTKPKGTTLPSSTAIVTQIVRLLDESRASTGMHTYEHFHRALGVWEAALSLVPMDPWLEACRGLEKGLEPLSRALGLLILEATQNYQDVLGNVYMELGQGEKRLGQYFTPYPVARMMAEMILGDIKPLAPGEPPQRMLEPCCGSGVLILAAAEVIESRCPGAIARGEVEFYGIDLDPVCVAMCRLNLRLHRIGHKVQTIEELTPAQRRTIERFLGYPLPDMIPTDGLPDIRAGDSLAPYPVTRDPAADETLSPDPLPGDEQDTEIADQGLWNGRDAQVPASPASSRQPHPRRKERSSQEQRAVPSQLLLFSEDIPF